MGARPRATNYLEKEHLLDWGVRAFWGDTYIPSWPLLALASSPACLQGGTFWPFVDPVIRSTSLGQGCLCRGAKGLMDTFRKKH